MICKYKWLIYYDILKFSHGDCKIKSKDFTTEGYTSQGIFFLQISERFKANKWCHGFEQCKTEFKTELCTNDHIIAKINNFGWNMRQK